MKDNKNPLNGKAYFDKKNNLCLEKGIEFGGQISNNKVKPREWFYLLLDACKESISKEKYQFELENLVGSRATQWRMRKQLLEKGLID